jgi:flagellar biosynthesis protein FlhB
MTLPVVALLSAAALFAAALVISICIMLALAVVDAIISLWRWRRGVLR